MEYRFKFNSVQSNITTAEVLDNFIIKELEKKELSKDYLQEVRTEFLDFYESVEFIQNLSSSERKRVKDLKRYDFPYSKERKETPDGKIEPNLTNPHILEDMDYFRQPALTFQKTGRYTHLYPNSNPNSEYSQYWKEEARRCREGLVRPDGEWIPGYYYFYLNYSVIQLTGKDENTGLQSRTESFPDVYDGDYIYFHYINKAREQGKHVITLKRRGSGFSFKASSQLGRNFILGETEISKTNVKSFAIANEKEYLTKDGILNKFSDVINFCANNTPFPRVRELKDSLNDMEWKMGYKDKITGRAKGVQNSVMGVTLKNNVQRARGKRGALIIWEEAGSFSDFLAAWGIARPSVEEGDYTFGLMAGFGTGGEEGVDFEGLEEVFYNPKGYNILSMPNVFDRNINGKTTSSFFFGAYLNNKGYYDNNGNSNVIGALLNILVSRINIKYNTQDPNAIVQAKAETPITPAEAIMKTEGSAFPVALLRDYLETIKPNFKAFTDEHYVGILKYSDGKINWFPKTNITPIRKFPLKDKKNLDGAIEIFEMPKKDRNSKVFRNRYIGGCLTPTELVRTSKGFKKAKDITLKDKLINKEGEIVDIKRVIKYKEAEHNTYTFKVANTLRTTTFTEEHPIYVSEEKFKYHGQKNAQKNNLPYRYRTFDFNFKEAKNIKKGEWTKVPNTYRKINRTDNFLWDKYNGRIDRVIQNPLQLEEFWWFIGLWLGDGWVESDGYGISISLNNKETEYINKLKYIVTKLFKRKYSITEGSNCIELHFSFQQLNNFLTENFNKGALNKVIPEWVKYISPSLKYNLIAGYLASDGCIISQKGYFSTEFVSISISLLEGLQDILFSIGIISAITLLRKEKVQYIGTKKVKCKETYHLRIAHNDSIKLKKLIDWGKCHKLNKISTDLIKNEKKKDCYFNEDFTYIYFRIKDIKKDKYQGEVFNFECDTNTFLCNNITTHNCDPVDNDYTTGSLASIFILDLWTDRIVAEYTGRPLLASDFYDNCIYLAEFYNAPLNYENNLKGLFIHFNNLNKVHLLCDTPQYLRDIELVTSIGYGNTAKGTRGIKEINKLALTLQRQWMLTPQTTLNEEEEEITYRNYQKIRSIGYLEECINHNMDGNFDRISAVGMLMILREDYKRNLTTFKEQDSFIEDKDDFIDNNWRGFANKHNIDSHNIGDKLYTPHIEYFKEETI